MRAIYMIMILLSLLPKLAFATNLFVPTDYPNINAACEVAVSGDTVGVMEGVYSEPSIWVEPGVTVIGLAPDSSLVKVFSQASSGIFITLSGADPIIIENMELHGDTHDGIIGNLNDGLIVQRCKLVVETDGYDETTCLHTYADMTVRKCCIFLDCHGSGLLSVYEASNVLLEDCVIWAPQWLIGDIASGSAVELRNNTVLSTMIFVFRIPTDTSFFAVNNVLERLEFYIDEDELPEILEFRYNDFVSGLPNPSYGYQIGNFSIDPMFCDPGSYPNPTNGDYRLQPESPCRLAGEHLENVGARLGICWPFSGVSKSENERSIQLFVSTPHPNPTIGTVKFSAQLPTTSIVRFEILDLNGRVVWSEAPALRHGTINYTWDGTMLDGFKAPTGTYYIRLSSGDEVVTKPVCILR